MTDIRMLLGILASGFMDDVDRVEFGMSFVAFDVLDFSGKRVAEWASKFLASQFLMRGWFCRRSSGRGGCLISWSEDRVHGTWRGGNRALRLITVITQRLGRLLLGRLQ